ncbi:hypothetical protein AABB24_034139 [Solanum stoloniferum]|uniref:Uncharacterized protein n=1 Tax=Solanum stoloniferum TaxID=62892 RepID=A0ABD2RE91_9SOLN
MSVQGVEITLSEEVLGIILDIPCKVIRFVKGCKTSIDYVQRATKFGDLKCAWVPKKFIKVEHQLYFEFVNMVLLPRTEKRIVASSTYLFVMEQLDIYEAINLPGIMLERMHRIMTVKNGKHGITYKYL